MNGTQHPIMTTKQCFSPPLDLNPLVFPAKAEILFLILMTWDVVLLPHFIGRSITFAFPTLVLQGKTQAKHGKTERQIFTQLCTDFKIALDK